MLFHTLLSPESGEYFVQIVYALPGALNVQAFSRAFQSLVDRHAILRTSIVWEKLGKPLQLVHRQVTFPLVQQDWRNYEQAEQDARLEELLSEDRKRGFTLSEAPLMRATLIRTAAEAYKFVLSSHHLLLDGWSVALLLKEFSESYRTFCSGEQLNLQPTRPYRDYISWLQEQDLAEAELFWRHYLEGISAPTPLTQQATSEKSSRQEQRYGEQYLCLPPELTQALRSLGQQHRLTINTVLQGAWALLLSRYSGQEDVVFGFTSAGRPPTLDGVEGMIGLFINTLPIRIQVPAGASIISWLQDIQEQQLELRRYDYTPLVEIHGWSAVPRNLPLFESIIEFENYPIDELLKQPARERKAGTQRSRIGGFGRTNYALTMCLADEGDSLVATLGYRTDVFDDAAISRLLGHFETILESFVANTNQHLSETNILSMTERRQLEAWNETKREYPTDQCVHHLFELQAERDPQAIALVHNDEPLTYYELNCRANQVAHHLLNLGVGPEMLVGICVERSVDMVIAMLAVLKSGAAYVGLDPNYPEQRLQFILEDSASRVLILHRGVAEKIRPSKELKLVWLDSDKSFLSGKPTTNPNPTSLCPLNLAYVMYTSGSTGRPKGVAITHRSTVCLLYWAREVFSADDLAGVLATTSICFDCSVFELFGPLSWGGKAILAENVLQLPTMAQTEQVTLISAVPTTLSELLRGGELPESVRTINLGGESSPDELFRRLREQKHLQKLIHLYGPTEDTTYSTFCFLSTDAHATRLSIGCPLANEVVHVLDSHYNVVPVAVPGELYIGGEGLARGYFNQPALTAQNFIPDSISKKRGQRLYKTGDVGVRSADGSIRLLGRMDSQIKLRGYRIELGEIEVVLRKHPAIEECVVVVTESIQDQKQLLAYVVQKPGQGDCRGNLGDFLRERLPNYLVPSGFIVLDALPLMPNGKLNRAALLPPSTGPLTLERAFVAPRDRLESELTFIWEELFDTKPISILDNFFDLGGHSLLALSLVSRIQRSFGTKVPLVELFEEPTVAHLADLLRGKT